MLALLSAHNAGFGRGLSATLALTRSETSKETAFNHHNTPYYHHKYLESDSGDGLVVLDKLFGSWGDGSPEAEARMNARYEKKKAPGSTRSKPVEASCKRRRRAR